MPTTQDSEIDMKVHQIDDVPARPVTMEGVQGATMRMLIGPDEGAPTFHMRCFEVAPGGHTPHHQHDYEHEILILQGQGIARSKGGDIAIKPGTAIFVPANERHQFVNNSAQTLRFICLIPAPKDCTRC
jgi:quercetin dioxygenase-like cupin family protein